MVMLPDALTLILPEASMVMSLPAIVIVPSFFIVIEADDQYFSEGEARLFLETLGAVAVERVTEADE